MVDVSQPVAPPARRRRISSHTAWPLGFAALAIAIFALFYVKQYGDLNDDFIAWLDRWMPLVSINESLVFVICALGLNIVVGYAGLLDLGFVAFWAIGGYVAGWLMSDFFHQIQVHVLGSEFSQRQNLQGIHLNFWMVLVLGAIVCAVAGVFIGAPTLRLRSDYLALVTLGFGEIIPQFFLQADDIGGVNVSNGSKGIGPIDAITSVGLDGNGAPEFKDLGPFEHLPRYVLFVLLAILIIFISLRLRTGRLGRAWLAIREDELAASAMGVPLMRTKLAAYAIGAVAGGIAGVAYATHVNTVQPTFSFTTSIILLAMVVLGGMGNVWGVMVGALVLSWINNTGLRQIGEAINDTFDTEVDVPSYQLLVFGLILVLMMLFRREGLIPEARTRLVLREPGRTEAEALGADMEEQAPELEALPEGVIHHDTPRPPGAGPVDSDGDVVGRDGKEGDRR
jgi:branched-chain amino acid transport system permease protein